jgi:FlaA1/EpsC-like NDP-sugar epimerase
MVELRNGRPGVTANELDVREGGVTSAARALSGLEAMAARWLTATGIAREGSIFSWRRFGRISIVMALDSVAVMVSLGLLLAIFGFELAGSRLFDMRFLLQMTMVSGGFFFVSGLYRRSWRFVSFADSIALALTVFGGLLTAWAVALGFSGRLGQLVYFFPVVMLHASLTLILTSMLRLARRSIHEARRQPRGGSARAAAGRDAKSALLIGPPEWALSMIDMMRADKNGKVSVVGMLLPDHDDTIGRLGGVPVLGTFDDLSKVVERQDDRGSRPHSVIICDDGISVSKRDVARIVRRARDLGLRVSQINDPWSQLLQRQSKLDADNLPVSELLGRDELSIEHGAISRQIAGQRVLVTGAGGTIGSELVWQLASFRPSQLVLLDHAEFNLYSIEMRLREHFPDLDIQAELCNIREVGSVRRVFAKHRPVIVYHAAALKHVPIVEANPCAGVHTNIIGTRVVANAVTEFGARAMVQVSTDKAVNPVGMMGATKRVGELYSQSLDLCGVDDPDAPRFMTVRFGNVLGSSGSVVPLFQRQLLEGRPLTITHPDIERFFMTVPEAVQLILESSSRALEDGTKRGNIFILDMGKPVKILDLAHRMARLHGLEPDVDVQIHFTGLRPGEKLFEELFDSCEEQVDSGIPGLFEAQSNPVPLPLISKAIDQLEIAVAEGNHEEASQITHNLVNLPSSGVDMTSLFTRSPSVLRGSWRQLANEI